jgi:RNase P subunit RPR2
MTRFYTMTKNTLKRLSSREHRPLICKRCGNPLEIGQEVVSRCGGRSEVRYHKKCYEELWM